MKDEEIISMVKCALKKLYEDDGFLIKNKVNERSITHKLAEYLQFHFSQWNVDCEYNKCKDDIKKIFLYEDNKGNRIFPDIIIHKRGLEENLLVIEAKKQNLNGNNDTKKLEALTGEPYKYRLGLFIEFTNNCGDITLKTFKNGKEVS